MLRFRLFLLGVQPSYLHKLCSELSDTFSILSTAEQRTQKYAYLIPRSKEHIVPDWELGFRADEQSEYSLIRISNPVEFSRRMALLPYPMSDTVSEGDGESSDHMPLGSLEGEIDVSKYQGASAAPSQEEVGDAQDNIEALSPNQLAESVQGATQNDEESSQADLHAPNSPDMFAASPQKCWEPEDRMNNRKNSTPSQRFKKLVNPVKNLEISNQVEAASEKKDSQELGAPEQLSPLACHQELCDNNEEASTNAGEGESLGNEASNLPASGAVMASQPSAQVAMNDILEDINNMFPGKNWSGW